MEIWDNDDYETPIESYPGYIGCYFDGSFQPQSELEPLEGFDFGQYADLLDDFGQERRIRVTFDSTIHTIVFPYPSYPSVAEILDKLPTVKVLIDNGPTDAGPASGGILVFFSADGTSDEELTASISALRRALEADLASLEEWQRQENAGSSSGGAMTDDK